MSTRVALFLLMRQRLARLSALSLALLVPLALPAAVGAGRHGAAQGGRLILESDRLGKSNIFNAGPRGKGKPILDAPAGSQNFQPSVSPTGDLAFVSDRSGNSEIFVLAGGEGLTPITHNSSADFDPTWSPDGSAIAFVSRRKGTNDIFVRDLSGPVSAQRLTPSPSDDITPAWSPDGSAIAYASNRQNGYDLWLVDLSGHSRRIAHLRGAELDPSWSPDGRRLAFTRRRNGNYDVYSIRRDGTGLLRLTSNPTEDSQPAWSPDGSEIAFVRLTDRDYEVFLMGTDGQDQRDVTELHSSIFDIAPAWIPGSSKTDQAPLRAPAAGQASVCGPRSGTNGADVIQGTPSADVICGRGGNDTIFGNGGDDVIYGDGGKDKIFGGGGGDDLFGRKGRDTIVGGAGKDRIVSRDRGGKDTGKGGPGRQIDRARSDGVPPDKLISIEGSL